MRPTLVSVHTLHKSIGSNGLDKNCERCKEIGDNPFAYMDKSNLTHLYTRVAEGADSRSTPERQAMIHMQRAILHAQMLDELRGVHATA